MVFALKRVRAAAEEFGWEEVAYTPASRVIGFCRDGDRINVYYTTGTVGTCVDHPTRGRTQLFRRDRDWDGLRALLDNPRAHTGDGYYRKHGAARPEPSWTTTAATGLWAAVGDATDAVVGGVTPAETAVLALSESGYFVLEHDGGVWWSGVPHYLHNKLWGRQASLPSPDYVALDGGDAHTYYIQFTDGRSEWAGVPAELERVLLDRNMPVEQLAFAADGGWYVLFEDGYYDWEGLPLALSNLLNGRAGQSLAGVETIACGPDGEWFVRFLDGAWRCGDIPHYASRKLHSLKSQRKTIVSMSFGGYGNWAIMYA